MNVLAEAIEAERAEVGLQTQKFCRDCSHGICEGYGEWSCAHPNTLDLVSGQPIDASKARARGAKCGPIGLMWRAKGPASEDGWLNNLLAGLLVAGILGVLFWKYAGVGL